MSVDSIYKPGIAPNTRVAISQKNRVFSTKVNAKTPTPSQIGVLNTFSYDESRTVDPVRGIGFGDRIAELVPGMTEPMSIKLNRAMLYTASIVQELGYKGGVDGIVRSLRHHKWPFDLQQELVFSEITNPGALYGATAAGYQQATGDTLNAIVTQFIACWLESYSVDYSTDNALVMEDVTAKATDVVDGIGLDPRYERDNTVTGNSPSDNAGSIIYR